MSQRQALIASAIDLTIDHYDLIPVVQLLNQIDQNKLAIFDQSEFGLIYQFLELQVANYQPPLTKSTIVNYYDPINHHDVVVLLIAKCYHKLIFQPGISTLTNNEQKHFFTNLTRLIKSWKTNQSYQIIININVQIAQSDVLVYQNQQLYWTNKLSLLAPDQLLIETNQTYQFHPDWLKINPIDFNHEDLKFSYSDWKSIWILADFISQSCHWNWQTFSWNVNQDQFQHLKQNLKFPPTTQPITNLHHNWFNLNDHQRKQILTICQNSNLAISDWLIDGLAFNDHYLNFSDLDTFANWSKSWICTNANQQSISFQDHHKILTINFDQSIAISQYWSHSWLDLTNSILKANEDFQIEISLKAIKDSKLIMTNLIISCPDRKLTYVQSELNFFKLSACLKLISDFKNFLTNLNNLNLNAPLSINITNQTNHYHFKADCAPYFQIRFNDCSDLKAIDLHWKSIYDCGFFATLKQGMNFNFNDRCWTFKNQNQQLIWISNDQINDFNINIIKSYFQWWIKLKTPQSTYFLNCYYKGWKLVSNQTINYVLTNQPYFPFHELIRSGSDWNQLKAFYKNLYYASTMEIDQLIKANQKQKLSDHDRN